MGMGPSFIPKTQPSQIAARAYTDDFAAILVESPPGPRSMPVKARHAVRRRHKPTDNAWRHAAPLCGLLLLSAIAASWSSIRFGAPR